MLSERVSNAQHLIDEWNTLTDCEQYDILVRGIKNAAKRYNTNYAFKLYEFEELVSETWLKLQQKMTINYIQKVEQRTQSKVSIPFLIFLIANNTLTGVIQNKKRNSERETSLNKPVGKDEDLELMDILPCMQNDVERTVIGQVMYETILSQLQPQERTIMVYIADGYSLKEVGKITNNTVFTVRDKLQKIRKKLGRNGRTPVISFDKFSKEYEKVVNKELKPYECMRRLNMKESTFYTYINKFRAANNIPIAPSYARNLVIMS